MKMRVRLHDYARKRMRLAATGLPPGIVLTGPESPWFRPIDTMEHAAAQADTTFLSLGHYDYLSLSRHPEVRAAAKSAIDTVGIGAGASRLIGGEREIHAQFESALSDFLGTEATMTMGAGYLVSLSLIPHLVGADDLVVMDELAHSSVVHGAKATRATVRTFRHNDLDHLAQILAEQRERHGLCLIAVEGLYSMDGDIVDLPRLLDIRDAHDAWVMVDEAHSIGVLGPTGRGACEHFGVDPARVDILVGTLSKTFTSMGGFVSGRAELVNWLKFTLPGFVFSVGLSPAIAATADAALRVLRREPERVARLQALSRHFLSEAAAAGLATGSAIGAGIVPILFDTPTRTAAVSRALAAAGIYAPPIMHSGIGTGSSRIRFFLSADLDRCEIDRTLGIIRNVT
ncbi:aminotransferase class I/II-fold pyridoxal phosphate-dependent enzyme [Aquabacter spiritensis]|uniref:7-keto-8-aminopelargonate synthetase-like enzyme n=1 Tax=Aquabacter spiritensis TaxID=933073 RepID=A0A4R3LY49_9HYPH|nr:pyridoxal phosphate-dependent aminotransferase family protein [Aquabacter spiritensis]TCT05590.1 7-keto-8-aminopelargonate synthetase-like enzyme [Aquabacter spiritensis]